jgi:hypothetical protein
MEATLYFQHLLRLAEDVVDGTLHSLPEMVDLVVANLGLVLLVREHLVREIMEG